MHVVVHVLKLPNGLDEEHTQNTDAGQRIGLEFGGPKQAGVVAAEFRAAALLQTRVWVIVACVLMLADRWLHWQHVTNAFLRVHCRNTPPVHGCLATIDFHLFQCCLAAAY